jgi:hypothetical protein
MAGSSRRSDCIAVISLVTSGFALACSGLNPFIVRASAQGGPTTVTAPFKVVDNQGKVILNVSAVNGVPSLSVMDENGKSVVRLRGPGNRIVRICVSEGGRTSDVSRVFN